MAEQNTEQQIQVRQMTNGPANWSNQSEAEDGKFSYQLILDDGAEEAIIMPSAEAAEALRDLIQDAETLYWGKGNQVLVFGNIK